jgi:hypothetical protein
MRRCFIAILAVLTVHAFADEKVTYQDNVRPIFAASCLSCHNPDKAKAGLDLTTYGSTMNGSSDGKVITPGSPDESMLYLCVTFQEEPHMPQKGNKLADAQLETIKKWIAGGALESGSSVAVATKPKVEMKLTAAPTKKPQGAPPMPKEVSLDPIVRADRAAAPGAMAASPWAPLVAFSAPHQILLYDEKTFALCGVLPFQEGLAKTLRFSRNGSVLMAGGGVAGQSGHVVLYDVVSGKRIADIGEEFDEVLAADISPDQSLVALGGPAKKVKIYSTSGGKALHEMTAHTDWITAIAFSPDGVLLASGDRNGGLRVWEASTGNEFYTLNGHKGAITSLSFRADSNVLASSSEDGAVKLWDMNAGKQMKSIQADPGGVLSVDFAPDGKLVTAGRDRFVRIWNSNGTALRQLPPAKDIPIHAVFGDEGKLVISDDFTGLVRVSKVEDAKQLAELDVNPPTIAEQLAIARKKASDADAAAAHASDVVKYLETTIAKTQAEVGAAQASVAGLKKKADAAQASASTSATAADAAKAAKALYESANASAQAKSEELKRAVETVAKAKVAEETAREQTLAANADLMKWKQAEVTNSIAQTQREVADLSARAARMTEALAKIDLATKAIVEGPQRIASAKEQQAKAKAAVASALVMSHQSQAGVIALEGIAVRSNRVVHALGAVDSFALLIQTQVKSALQQSDNAAAAVAQAAAASNAADAAVASIQAEQQAAPKVIADAKAIISDSLTDRIAAAKAKLDALSQQARVLSASR